MYIFKFIHISEVKKMVGQGEIWTNGLTGQAEKIFTFEPR